MRSWRPSIRRSPPQPARPQDWDGWVQERGLYFARTLGRRLSAAAGDARPGRGAARRRAARGPGREGDLRLHRAQLLPPASGRRARARSGCSPTSWPCARRVRADRARSRACSCSRRAALRRRRARRSCSTPRTAATSSALLEHAFEARHPDIDVRWLDMGSQEILDRLRFERVNPQADVWFGGPTTIFDRGVHDSLLAPYRPAGRSAVGPSGVGPDDLYYPVYRTPGRHRVQQSGRRAATRRRRTGTRCSSAAWTDKVLIRDPMASGTMRAIWGLILVRSIRETGDTARGMALAAPARRADQGLRAEPGDPRRPPRPRRGTGDALGPARHPDQPRPRGCRSTTSSRGAARS